MISKKALLDIQHFQDEGCQFKATDILELNELGCQCEQNINYYDTLATTRRCVRVGKVILVEPSLLSESWYQDFILINPASTILELLIARFLVYIVPFEELPEVNDLTKLEQLIKSRVFPILREMPCRQAININEFLQNNDGQKVDNDEDEDEDEDELIVDYGANGKKVNRKNHALGLIHLGKIHNLGFGIEEYSKMTPRQVVAAINIHQQIQPMNGGVVNNDRSLAEANYRYQQKLEQMTKANEVNDDGTSED